MIAEKHDEKRLCGGDRDTLECKYVDQKCKKHTGSQDPQDDQNLPETTEGYRLPVLRFT